METCNVGFRCPKCGRERSAVDAITEEGKPEPTSCAQCEQEKDEPVCKECGGWIEDADETRDLCYACHDKTAFCRAQAEQASMINKVLWNIVGGA
jgi:hypothetical protein